jgi:excisionase family DNA binding protein
MSKKGRDIKIFSALEVAKLCGVVNQTAINWIKNGHLKAFTTPGGQYRIYAKDLSEFLDKRGMGDSSDALQIILEKANWKALLVAACDAELVEHLATELEQKIPGMTVLKAFDGVDIGMIINEEKPGFILVDGFFPGVDMARLVRTLKTDPNCGKPYIFLMNAPGEGLPEHDLVDGVFSKPPELNKIVEAITGFGKRLDSAATA